MRYDQNNFNLGMLPKQMRYMLGSNVMIVDKHTYSTEHFNIFHFQTVLFIISISSNNYIHFQKSYRKHHKSKQDGRYILDEC